jgi:alkylhydroperoxidase family enzyme
MAIDPEQREAQILGQGPRILPLEIEELTERLDDLGEMLAPMIAINAVVASREADRLTDIMDAETTAADMRALLAELPEIMRTMLRHPSLFARQAEIGVQLIGKGVLAPRDRELAILRMGWLCQAPYEWGEHVLIARSVGITRDEIEAITIGSAAPGWDAHEAAILRAVEELHADAMISDATWAVLAERLDERQLIELPSLIGQYQAVAYYQNSLRLRLHGGNLGLRAR